MYRCVQRKRLKRHASSFKAVICNAFVSLFDISVSSGVKVGFQMPPGSYQAWGESSRPLVEEGNPGSNQWLEELLVYFHSELVSFTENLL